MATNGSLAGTARMQSSSPNTRALSESRGLSDENDAVTQSPPQSPTRRTLLSSTHGRSLAPAYGEGGIGTANRARALVRLVQASARIARFLVALAGDTARGDDRETGLDQGILKPTGAVPLASVHANHCRPPDFDWLVAITHTIVPAALRPAPSRGTWMIAACNARIGSGGPSERSTESVLQTPSTSGPEPPGSLRVQRARLRAATASLARIKRICHRP